MKEKKYRENRRQFIKGMGFTVGATLFSSPIYSFMTEVTGNPERIKNKKDTLGIALVGLGQYSTNQLAPALVETENCYLAGIVTGTPTKAEAEATASTTSTTDKPTPRQPTKPTRQADSSRVVQRPVPSAAPRPARTDDAAVRTAGAAADPRRHPRPTHGAQAA